MKEEEKNEEKNNCNEQNISINNESNNSQTLNNKENIEINNIERNKYYIPVCPEKNCNGHLRISIDEDKFIINAKCQRNKEHIFNNLYFETFQKYYLKEITIQKCFKCLSNLDNKNQYECKKCQKIYCSNCFFKDEHFKENIDNINLMTNRCPKDQNELSSYCLNCDQKFCSFCFKKYEEKNPHKNHKIVNITNSIPSLEKIKNLEEKIRKKSDAFDSLIKSLNEWQNELNKKIERIKKKLKNEISIIQKLFLNFNIDYIDYTYYSNFNEFYSVIDDYNNKYLKQFMEAYNFNERTRYIFKLLTANYLYPEVINNNYQLTECYSGNGGLIIENFKDKFCLYYSNFHKYISIVKLVDNEFTKYIKLEFNEKIFSLNISPDKKKVYACLDNKKSISIFNFDPKENILKLTEEKIDIDTQGHFNKCIHINNDCLIITEDKAINLFCKNNLNYEKFTNINKITFENKIYDICQINDKLILISQKSKLTFINIENLSIEKVINNIDCLEKPNNLILIKDCILVNCEKGIALISIKTQEMFQYIFDNENLGDKTIVAYDDYIYILNSYGYLLKYHFYDYTLILNEKSKIERIKDKNSLEMSFFKNNNLLVTNNCIYIWLNIIYNCEAM